MIPPVCNIYRTETDGGQDVTRRGKTGCHGLEGRQALLAFEFAENTIAHDVTDTPAGFPGSRPISSYSPCLLLIVLHHGTDRLPGLCRAISGLPLNIAAGFVKDTFDHPESRWLTRCSGCWHSGIHQRGENLQRVGGVNCSEDCLVRLDLGLRFRRRISVCLGHPRLWVSAHKEFCQVI